MTFLERIQAAGIVGCGGAGFPAHVKWNAEAAHLIVNAVECEPLLCTDRYLMRTYAGKIAAACAAVAEQLHARETVIAIKAEYRAEIEALERAIGGRDSIRLHRLESFYPAGDEQVLVYEITGKTVPCGGIPLDVGAVVSNVATILAAGEALEGRPLTHKFITVAGEVRRPCIVRAPVGTTAAECIRAAGGAAVKDPLIVAGGPMMGTAISEEPERLRTVTKTTSGLLVFSREHYMARYKGAVDLEALRKKAAVSCIQCSYCTMLCPRHLLGHPLEPHRIMRTIAAGGNLTQLMKENEALQNAALCSACGVCTVYACPMGLQPSRVNALLKEELGRSGIRAKRVEAPVPLEERPWRKAPTHRLTARLDAARYEGMAGGGAVEIRPAKVSIRLRQGIGKTPEAVVKAGDFVEAGTMIAQVPEGTLGSCLHASISGVVTEISDVITIVGG